MNNGWIKLHRCLLDKAIFDNPKLLKVFIWCLCKASHKDHQQLVGRRVVNLKAGQFIFGRYKNAEELNIKPTTLWDYVKLLESNNTIDIISDSKYSIISIVNWGNYQSCEEISDSKSDSNSDNKWTANGQLMDTNKNVKNEKNNNTTINGDDSLLTTGTKSNEETKEKKKREGEKKERRFDDNSEELSLAYHLAEKIKAYDSNLKIPTYDFQYQKWALTIDRMIRLDNRKVDDIYKLIDYIYTKDEFWAGVIQHADSLRKNYDKVYLKMKKEKKTKGGDTSNPVHKMLK